MSFIGGQFQTEEQAKAFMAMMMSGNSGVVGMVMVGCDGPNCGRTMQKSSNDKCDDCGVSFDLCDDCIEKGISRTRCPSGYDLGKCNNNSNVQARGFVTPAN